MKETWRQRWRRQALVGVMLLAALTAFSPTSRSEAGTISGTVTDGDGAAIPNVAVKAVNIDDSTETIATIAANGITYTLDSLAAGTYKLEFSGDGHVSEWYEDAPMKECATPLELTDTSETTANAVLAAPPELPISITGTVTDSADAGVAGAEVCAYLDGETQPAKDDKYCATTADADEDGNGAGKYEIKGLDAGKYKLEIIPPTGENSLSEWYEDKTTFADATLVEVTEDATEPATADVKLDAGGSITGTVQDAAGNPLGNAEVKLYDSNDDLIKTEYTSDVDDATKGKYTFNGLSSGTYTVKFCADGYLDEWFNDTSEDTATDITVAAPDTTNIDNIAVTQLTMGDVIQGKVFESDGTTGLAGAKVCAYFDDEDPATPQPAKDDKYCDTTADDSDAAIPAGSYEIVGLAVGENYKLEITAPDGLNLLGEWHQDEEDFDSATSVTAASEATATDTNVTLTEGHIIKGVVRTEADLNGDGTADDPVAGAEVCAYFDDEDPATPQPAKDDKYCDTTADGSDAAIPAGSYTIDGLAVGGKYKLEITAPSEKNLLDTWYGDAENAADFDTATAVTATATGATADVTLDVGNIIKGVVSTEADLDGDDTADGPVAGAEVCAYLDGETQPAKDDKYCATTADADEDGNGAGSYEIVGLNAADYNLEITITNGANLFDEWYEDKATFADATAVTATATGATADVTLDAGGSISGTVTNNGEPFKCVLLNYYGPELPTEEPTSSMVESIWTDYQGKYTISGLKTGLYKVRFINNNSFVDVTPSIQYYNRKLDYTSATEISVTVPDATTDINAAWPFSGGKGLIPKLQLLLLD
jgi:protocatechuate 3,4-dioxygenase beta subunit